MSAYGFLWSIISGVWVLALAYIVLSVIAGWKVYEKAGQPGWAAIVPFYSNYIEFKIFWGNGWLFVVPLALGLLGGIPLLGSILSLLVVVIYALTCYKKALSFGQGIGFAVGLFFLNPIFTMILAFGQYRYLGVPQDGTSYDQLKAIYDKQAAKQHEREAQVNFTEPPQEKQTQTVYTGPVYAQPQQPEQPAASTEPQQPAESQPAEPEQGDNTEQN